MPKKLLSLMLILGILSCSGCWDKLELEEQAFIMSVCIDQGQHCKYLWTFRIAIPRKLVGGQGAGGGAAGGEKTTIMVSVEANTLFDALNLMSTFIDRKANLMHTKIVVLGEKVARSGDVPVKALIRYREVRRSVFVLVAKGMARDILLKNKPGLELNPSKFFESLATNGTFTGLIPKSQLHDFLIDTQSLDREAVVMLVGLTKGMNQSQIPKTVKDAAPYIAGQVPRAGDTPVEVIGSAVFDGGKMVGTLTGTENRVYEMITNSFFRGFKSIPDPQVADNFIALDVRAGAPTSVTARLGPDGTPAFNVQVILEADILSIQSDVDYTSVDKLKTLEKAAARVIEQEIQKTIKKTQDLGTDIFGFGSKLREMVPTYPQWVALNWKAKGYPKAKINVHAKVSIRRIGLNFNPPVNR